MLRSPDWNQTYAAVRANLGPDEPLRALFTGLTPAPERDGVVIAGELAPLVWVMWHATWRRTTRAASRSADFPLAPRMIIAVTGRRLVVWAAKPRWRLGKTVGDVPRDRITGITSLAAGTRSRTIVLHLSTGRTVTLLVATAASDLLTSAFGPDPARRPDPGQTGTHPDPGERELSQG
ncbi:MAG TPA: hypothetical protein VGN41_17955 [Streptosporangiaceae bacterium]